MRYREPITVTLPPRPTLQHQVASALHVPQRTLTTNYLRTTVLDAIAAGPPRSPWWWREMVTAPPLPNKRGPLSSLTKKAWFHHVQLMTIVDRRGKSHPADTDEQQYWPAATRNAKGQFTLGHDNDPRWSQWPAIPFDPTSTLAHVAAVPDDFKGPQSKYNRKPTFDLAPPLRPRSASSLQYYDLAEQLGTFACSICHHRVATCIDHCHVSGYVRGLLCRICNNILYAGPQMPAMWEPYLQQPPAAHLQLRYYNNPARDLKKHLYPARAELRRWQVRVHVQLAQAVIDRGLTEPVVFEHWPEAHANGFSVRPAQH